MQMQSAERTVNASGITALRKSRIIMDGTAVQILSSGIYSNKIGSLVRECYSNAHDSHTSAGNPDAPVITLPSALDLTFSIKDQGLGMSLDSVLNALDYFSSDKRNDNVGIGFFGLGFKSPYSYTDQFTVISIHEGTRYIVSAVMGEDGIPAPMLLSEESTDEPNGVEIRVPVQSVDCGLFAREVAGQLKLFEPRPTILGDQINWPDTSVPYGAVVLPGIGHVTSVPRYRSYLDQLTVRIGPVEYPIDRNQVAALVDPKDTDTLAFIERVAGCLYCDIGDVDPAPSREALQYTKQSLKALVAKIKQLEDGYVQALKDQLDALPNLYEANRMVASWQHKFGNNPEFFSKLTYKTVAVEGTWRLPTVAFTGARMHTFTPGSFRERYIFNQYTTSVIISPAKTTAVFIDDLPSVSHRQGARLKLFMESHTYNLLVVLRGCTLSDIPEFTGFPEEDVFYLSELNPPAPKTRAYTGKGTQTKLASQAYRLAYRSMQNTHELNCTYFSDPCAVIPTSGYYVVSRNGVLDQQTQRRLACTDVLPGDVYIINTTDSRSIVRDTPLLPFDAAFDAALKDQRKELKARLVVLAETPDIDHYWETLFECLVEIGVKPKSSPKPLWKCFNMFYQQKDKESTRQTMHLIALTEFQKFYLDKQKAACDSVYAITAARDASEPLLCRLMAANGLPYGADARAAVVADIHKKYFS